MQNWNQWQLPVAPVTAPMPQPPIGYAAPGADPMATMQAYMQYYNQPVSTLSTCIKFVLLNLITREQKTACEFCRSLVFIFRNINLVQEIYRKFRY